MRAFVALGLSAEANARFIGLQNQLRAQVAGVSWARAGDVHITLAFFSDLAESNVDDVRAAMNAAAQSAAPRLRLHGLGAFPNQRRPRVIWCGVEDEAGRMAAIRDILVRALREKEVAFDDKPFAPHCTLGRIRRGLSGEGLSRWQDLSAQLFAGDWWQPNALTLFESHGGYRPLIEVALGG